MRTEDWRRAAYDADHKETARLADARVEVLRRHGFGPETLQGIEVRRANRIMIPPSMRREGLRMAFRIDTRQTARG